MEREDTPNICGTKARVQMQAHMLQVKVFKVIYQVNCEAKYVLLSYIDKPLIMTV